MLSREEYHRQVYRAAPQRHVPTSFKPRRRRHWSVFLLLIVVLLCGFYLVVGMRSAKTFNHESYDPHNQSVSAEQRIDHRQPISVLMMGTDTGALGRRARGRTDTMMINTINPEKQEMALTSIPRDAPARYGNVLTKINSVYTLGGANQAERYVQTWLGVPINYYMIINMGGLSRIINQVGGVEVNPPLTFHYEAANVHKNQKVTLNGMQALDYCRMRHQDPLGDYGRQMRQRQVLFQLFDKISKVHSLFMHPSLANALSHNMKTNLSVKDLMTLMAFYRHASRHHISTHLQGRTKQINGQDFEVVPPSERAAKAREIQSELN